MINKNIETTINFRCGCPSQATSSQLISTRFINEKVGAKIISYFLNGPQIIKWFTCRKLVNFSQEKGFVSLKSKEHYIYRTCQSHPLINIHRKLQNFDLTTIFQNHQQKFKMTVRIFFFWVLIKRCQIFQIHISCMDTVLAFLVLEFNNFSGSICRLLR